MAVRRKTGSIVDGFTTIQAVQRASSGSKRRKKATPRKTAAPRKEQSAKKKQAPSSPQIRIGHTIQPTKHDIICYECGYFFKLTGQFEKTYCPKCRCILDAKEKKIDKEWSGTLRTIGVVNIGANGVVKGGSIIANNIVLAGRIDAGKVVVHCRLEVCAGGQFNPEVVDARDLVVRNDAKLSFARKLTFKNIEILGEIKAKINATGVITLRAGGVLRGEIRGQHLIVEDGGELKAKITVTSVDPDVKASQETDPGR